MRYTWSVVSKCCAEIARRNVLICEKPFADKKIEVSMCIYGIYDEKNEQFVNAFGKSVGYCNVEYINGAIVRGKEDVILTSIADFAKLDEKAKLARTKVITKDAVYLEIIS